MNEGPINGWESLIINLTVSKCSIEMDLFVGYPSLICLSKYYTHRIKCQVS